MCQFLSAIVMRNGDVRMHDLTDSHSEMGLKREGLAGKLEYARVEFAPSDFKTVADPKTYTFRLDEERKPDWWNDDLQAKVIEKMSDAIRRMVLPKGEHFKLGGKWVASDGVVLTARHAILWAYGSSKVTACGSSKVTACDSSKVTAYGSSEVTACDSSKVTAYGSSKVTACGSSKVTAYDSSEVTAYGSSKVTRQTQTSSRSQ